MSGISGISEKFIRTCIRIPVSQIFIVLMIKAGQCRSPQDRPGDLYEQSTGLDRDVVLGSLLLRQDKPVQSPFTPSKKADPPG